MDTIDLTDHYENRSIVNMTEAKNKLNCYYANSWPEKCRNVPKLRTYIQFKHSFKTEDYLTLNSKRNERSVMAQF